MWDGAAFESIEKCLLHLTTGIAAYNVMTISCNVRPPCSDAESFEYS